MNDMDSTDYLLPRAPGWWGWTTSWLRRKKKTAAAAGGGARRLFLPCSVRAY